MLNRLLIVDDDLDLCELLSEYLCREGFEFEVVHNGRNGLDLALSGDYVLIILDVMLPGMNGFDVLRQLRLHSETPVLMLTARGDDVDRIVGLEMGADDYLPKPFNPRELIARVRAILRRLKPETEDPAMAFPEQLEIGDVSLDKAMRVVTRAGERLALTAVEFGLLAELMNAAGRVITREDLVKATLGRVMTAYDRSIDTHMSNLRRKLGRYRDGDDRIKTVRGVGYFYVRPRAGG
jgi:DNA-binding response OmpR family regulator